MNDHLTLRAEYYMCLPPKIVGFAVYSGKECVGYLSCADIEKAREDFVHRDFREPVFDKLVADGEGRN